MFHLGTIIVLTVMVKTVEGANVSQNAEKIEDAIFKPIYTNDVFNAERVKSLSSANIKFAVDVYKNQARATDGNIFFSPLSISVALGMTYLGARAETKSQMKQVLHFSDVEEDHLHQTFADIQSALNKPEQPYKLYTANRLFADKSYKILDEFLAAGRKYYAADLEPVDFR